MDGANREAAIQPCLTHSYLSCSLLLSDAQRGLLLQARRRRGTLTPTEPPGLPADGPAPAGATTLAPRAAPVRAPVGRRPD